MDITATALNFFGLFVLGAIGALITAYIAKGEAIPEFRATVDVSDKEIEARRLRAHYAETQTRIDTLQTELEKPDITPGRAERLQMVISSSQQELESDSSRLRDLEPSIDRNRGLARFLGVLFYVGLGGVFGALLTGRVHVEGVTEGLPTFYQSIAIGATWTTWLNTVGIKAREQKVEQQAQTEVERVTAEAKKPAAELEQIRDELTRLRNDVAKAETSDARDNPEIAFKIDDLTDELRDLSVACNVRIDSARQMAVANIRGITKGLA